MALTIPNLLLRQRKDIMTLCRTQFPASSGTVLREHLNCMEEEIEVVYAGPKIGGERFRTRVKLSEYLEDPGTIKLYTSPIFASTISLLLRIAPVPDTNEVDETILGSIEKEVGAGINIYHPVCFDYSPIFSKDRRLRRWV